MVNWYTRLLIKLSDLLCHVLADIQQKHTSKPKESAAYIYGDNIRCFKGGVSRYWEQFLIFEPNNQTYAPPCSAPSETAPPEFMQRGRDGFPKSACQRQTSILRTVLLLELIIQTTRNKAPH